MNEIEIIRSDRRTVSVEIRQDLRVIVRAPRRMATRDIQRFIDDRTPWIEKHMELARQRQCGQAPALTADEIKALAAAAMTDFPPRVARFEALIGVTAGGLAVRSQKTRWGSCSSRGSLSFNCLLMLCPEHIRDYVVVHELCHLRELNHSPRFWALVRQALPDFAERRKWLKVQGAAIIGRLR